MAVPAYLAASFHYKETGIITDAADVITAVRDELVNQNDPAWTDQGGGLFRSPVDASGRWIDILLTRIAATNLEMRARDNAGQTIVTGRMQIQAGGRIIRIFSGQFHFHIESVIPGGASEYVRAGILDLSPESQTAHGQWCYAMSHRDTSDVVRTLSNQQDGAFMWDNNAYALAGRFFSYFNTSSGGSLVSPSGGYIFMAVGAGAKAPGEITQYCYAGRLYNHMIGDHDRLVAGAEFTIPIDAGTFGTFKVSGISRPSYSCQVIRIA
jgi:hypothetical protein